MPNIKGGKAYKKTKHGNTDNAVFIDLEKDQMYGRMTKSLGGLNVMVYCNDDKERICHIRGSMRKKVWVNVGDLVIVSLRDFSADEKGKERGDVVAKVDAKFHSRLRKDSKVNERLFLQMDENRAPVMEEGYVMEENASESGEEKEKQEEEDRDVDIDDI